MDPKAVIERIHAENIAFGNARMAASMAYALDQLSAEIYTEYIRFLFELVQNADDAKASRLVVQVLEGHLVVAHDGDPFSERDVEALCSIGQGTKLSDPNKTGYKGIGFKSVFGRSKKVSVFSQGFQFSFQHGFAHPKWPDTKMPWQTIPVWVEREAYPKGVFDLPDGEWNVVTVLDLPGTEELQTDLAELIGNGEVLLFLRNLVRIDVSGAMQLSVALEMKAREATFTQMSITRNGKPKSEWLIRTFGDIRLDQTLRKELATDDKTPDKLKEIERTEITLASKVKKGHLIQVDREESLIYTYLPTKVGGFRFPFLLNASFLTNAGREELHEDRRWNAWLLEQAAARLVDWMAELAATAAYRNDIVELLPTTREGGPLADSFHKALGAAIQAKAFIPNAAGKLLKPGQALIDQSGLTTVDFISPEAVVEYINKTKDTQLEVSALVATDLRKRERLAQWGAAYFTLDDLEAFFTDEVFKEHHQPEQNPALMRYLHQGSQDPRKEELGRLLPDLPFIYAKGKVLRSPKRICFPTKADLTQVEQDVKVIHTEVFEAIKADEFLLQWLERLGVAEVSEVGWLERELLPTLAAEKWKQESMDLIRTLCRLNDKGLLSDMHTDRLGELPIETKRGSYARAASCYLGSEYEPSLDLEEIGQGGFLVSGSYLENGAVSKQKLKALFLRIGVVEDIALKRWQDPIPWSNNGYGKFIDREYNDRSSNWPYHEGGAVSDPHVYRGYYKVSMLERCPRDPKLAKLVLSRIFSGKVEGVAPSTITGRVTFLHGYRQDGWKSVLSHPHWLLLYENCFPAEDGGSYRADQVFVNKPEVKAAIGGYLPVLDCAVVPDADWLEVIPFKRELELEDCLTVLSGIHEASTNGGSEQSWSSEQLRLLYGRLLELVGDMTSEERQTIVDWGESGHLLAADGTFNEVSRLKWVKLTGNLTGASKSDQFFVPKGLEIDERFEKLLSTLGVQVIDRFEVEPVDREPANDLRKHLEGLLHYLVALEMVDQSAEEYDARLIQLTDALEVLQMERCSELSLGYIAGRTRHKASDIPAHLEGHVLYFVGDWQKPIVRHVLAPLLADALDIPDQGVELELLLQLDVDELDDRLRKAGGDPAGIPDEVRVQLRGSGLTTLPKALSEMVSELLGQGYTSEQIASMLRGAAEGSDGTGPGPSDDDLPSEARKEENELARRLVKEHLEQQGFVYSKGDGTHSVIDGVMKDKVEYPLVVKSYQNTSYPLKITPGEWLQLSKDRAMCLVHEGGGRLVTLDLKGLLKGNTHFHVQFRTDSFDLDGLARFAKVFRYAPDVRFQLFAPGFKVAASLEEYLFDTRSGKKLRETSDDDSLLS